MRCTTFVASKRIINLSQKDKWKTFWKRVKAGNKILKTKSTCFNRCFFSLNLTAWLYKYWLNSTFSLFGPSIVKNFTPFSQKGRKWTISLVGIPICWIPFSCSLKSISYPPYAKQADHNCTDARTNAVIRKTTSTRRRPLFSSACPMISPIPQSCNTQRIIPPPVIASRIYHFHFPPDSPL